MLHPAIGPGSLYLTLSCYLATYLFIDYRPIYLSIYLFTSNNFYSLKPTSQQDPHPLSQCASWTFMEHVFPANVSTVNLKLHWSKQSVGFKTTASYQCYLSNYFLGVIPTVRYIPKYILKRYQTAKYSYFFFFHCLST